MEVLSKDQHIALTEIREFMDWSNPVQEHILTGGPGMGKSYLVSKVLQGTSSNPILAAMTHQAASVLREFIKGEDVHTLHSLLSLKVIKDWVKNEDYIIKTNKQNNVLDRAQFERTLVIVDEVSMINAEVNFYLEKVLKQYGRNIKFLLVGDEDQVPAVESKKTGVVRKGIIFSKGIKTSRLTTTHRQDINSSIPGVADKLREGIQKESILFHDIPESRNVHYLEHQEFLDQMQAQFCLAKMNKDIPNIAALAYRNDVVKSFNKLIRSYFYSNPQLQIGENVVVNKAYKDGDIMVPTQSIVEVIDNKPVKNFYNIEGRLITTLFEGNEIVGVKPDNPHDIQTLRKKLIAEKRLKELDAAMESFIDVRPSYASTVHKSQGSTYKTVFIHLEDICSAYDRHLIPRLLYVAITRARENVYLYGEIPYHLLRD